MVIRTFSIPFDQLLIVTFGTCALIQGFNDDFQNSDGGQEVINQSAKKKSCLEARDL